MFYSNLTTHFRTRHANSLLPAASQDKSANVQEPLPTFDATRRQQTVVQQSFESLFDSVSDESTPTINFNSDGSSSTSMQTSWTTVTNNSPAVNTRPILVITR
jgi:hypothetical protein